MTDRASAGDAGRGSPGAAPGTAAGAAAGAAPGAAVALSLTPIGVIRSPHCDAGATPIQPACAEGCRGEVEVFQTTPPGWTMSTASPTCTCSTDCT